MIISWREIQPHCTLVVDYDHVYYVHTCLLHYEPSSLPLSQFNHYQNCFINFYNFLDFSSIASTQGCHQTEATMYTSPSQVICLHAQEPQVLRWILFNSRYVVKVLPHSRAKRITKLEILPCEDIGLLYTKTQPRFLLMVVHVHTFVEPDSTLSASLFHSFTSIILKNALLTCIN